MPLPSTFNPGYEKLPLFAYGTLRDADILRLVLKHSDHLTLQSAVLQGWHAVCWRDRSYPGIIPDHSASAEGALIFGLTAADWESLLIYEGAEYRLEICHPSSQGKTQQALIFTPLHRDELTTQPWKLDDWQRLHRNNYDIKENG